MRTSINKTFANYPCVIVAELKQGQESSSGKSEKLEVTAQNFRMFLQGIDGNLDAGIVAGYLFRGYICTSEIPHVSDIKTEDKLVLAGGQEFKVEGPILQDSNPLIKPFFKLELKKI